MKEVLYTIPLNDAYAAETECPFCFIENNIEQDLLDYVLGSCASYMEADTRAMTDKEGFCRTHFKKMYAYGNTLGNGWILKTHYMRVNRELHEQIKKYSPVKISLKDKLTGKAKMNNSVAAWIKSNEESCYICKRYDEMYDRYLATFFHLYKNDSQFSDKISKSKGFCLCHLKDVLERAETELSPAMKEEFFPMIFRVTEENMDRMQEDINWLIEKFDYRNKDADWKNSKDAVSRGMQNLKGGIYG